MKRIIVFCVAALLVFLVAGCTQTNTNSSGDVSLVVLEDKLAPEEYGIGFRKDDTALAAAVGNALAEMKEDGTLAEISQSWFGKDVTTISGEKVEAEPIEATKLTMGLDDSFPPMGFRDENGELVGFDVDVAKEVASRLDIELVLQPIDWAVKEQELATNKIDFIWNGYTITDQRKEQVLFTEAYMSNNQAAVVRSDSDYKTLDDLAGKKVGVQSGSSAMDAIEANEGFASSIELVEFKENTVALQDLEKGGVDAVVLDEVVANYYINTKSN